MVESDENRSREGVAQRRLAPAAGLFGLAGPCDEPRKLTPVAERFYRLGFRDGRMTRTLAD